MPRFASLWNVIGSPGVGLCALSQTPKTERARWIQGCGGGYLAEAAPACLAAHTRAQPWARRCCEEVFAVSNASGYSLFVHLLHPSCTLTHNPGAAWWIKMERGSVTKGSDSQPQGQTQWGLPLFKVCVRKGKRNRVWLTNSDANKCLMRMISLWSR